MPRRYIRKIGVAPRAIWTEEALRKAAEAVASQSMTVNTAARNFCIPARTLRRRMEKKEFSKHSLGKAPVLGYQNEEKLVKRIQNLEKYGFPCTRTDIRKMAYQLAEKFKIKHDFNNELKMAGKQWLQTFLERHKNLSVRQAEGMSRARAMGFSRDEIKGFFDLLGETLEENNLYGKPDRIFNMDESGVQMNNKPGKVVATKGSKLVQQVTSSEKGETVSIIACNSAEGRFLPPVLIMKGVNKKPEFVDGLPPGSDVYMNKKSAYINSELFLKWMGEHFIPRKPQGKVLLLLDGHASHTSNIETLERAAENDVILLGLPSHSTHGLQPLDKSFFKPLKTYVANELRSWVLTNKDRKVTRYQAGKIIGSAWGRAASTSNAIHGFKACGIYPYNPEIIPDYYFCVSDMANTSVADNSMETTSTTTQQIAIETNSSNAPVISTSAETEPANLLPTSVTVPNEPIPSTSDDVTPSKFLSMISPIPIVAKTTNKRQKQSAKVLNTDEEIQKKKEKATENLRKEKEKDSRKRKRNDKTRLTNIEKVKRRILQSHTNILYGSSSCEDDIDTMCCGCKEPYAKTRSTADWIQCISCRKWLHEDCTNCGDYCNVCGLED